MENELDVGASDDASPRRAAAVQGGLASSAAGQGRQESAMTESHESLAESGELVGREEEGGGGDGDGALGVSVVTQSQEVPGSIAPLPHSEAGGSGLVMPDAGPFARETPTTTTTLTDRAPAQRPVVPERTAAPGSMDYAAHDGGIKAAREKVNLPGLGMTTLDEKDFELSRALRAAASAQEGARGDARQPGSSSSTPYESIPASPSLAEAAGEIRRSLSLKNLRALDAQTVRRQIWRPENEPERRIPDWERVFVHAWRGGLRAFILGFSLKAGLNSILLLFKFLRTNKMTPAELVRAVSGPDNFRFGMMLGSFAGIWKFVLNGLRVLNDQKTEKWHSALAGFLSGFALIFEKKDRRIGIAQQLLVRGGQGWFNSLYSAGILRIPYASILIFALANAQIMFSYTMSPESIPKSYYRWIGNTGNVPWPSIEINRTIYREGYFPVDAIKTRILGAREITPGNVTRVKEWLNQIENGPTPPAMIPCSVTHFYDDSCVKTNIRGFFKTARKLLPVYLALHFVPLVAFRRKALLANPSKMLLRVLLGTARSAAFIGAFVGIYMSWVCSHRNLYALIDNTMPKWFPRLTTSRFIYWGGGAATSLSLLFEEPKRRGELALYCIPKALESLWAHWRKHEYVPFIPGGEILMGNLALASLMHYYVHEPAALSGLVRRIIYQFVGKM